MTTDGVNLFLAQAEKQTIVSLPTDPSLHREGTPPTILASNQYLVDSLTFDGGNLYWTVSGYGGTVSATGGTPTLLAGIGPEADGIAVRAGYIYWSAKGSVAKRPLAGGPVTQLSTTATTWSVGGAGILISETDRIVLHPFADGGAPRTIASTHGYNLMTMDDANVYWQEDDPPNSCGYVTSIYKTPLTGGTTTMLAQSRDRAGPLLVAGNEIYWAGTSAIFTMPRDGGTPRMVAETVHVNAMTISGNSLYWSDFANIYKKDLP
jgi:hypothetical protein